MKTKVTDSIITFDVAVTVHQYRKKATVKDKELAKWIQDQSEKAILEMLEHYTKTMTIKTGPSKFYLGDPR